MYCMACFLTQNAGGYDLFCFINNNKCIARTRKKRLTIKQIVVTSFTFLPPCLKHMHCFIHHEYEQKIRRFPFMSKAKSFVTGIICGGAVAGLAVLFSTPSSGKDMRNKLKEKGNDIKKTLADITADTKLLKRQIVETASEGKEVFQELKDDMQDTFSTWKKDISQNKLHIEQEILDIQKSIEKLQQAVPEKA